MVIVIVLMILISQFIFCQNFSYSDTLKLDKNKKFTSFGKSLILEENSFIFTFNYPLWSQRLAVIIGTLEENDESINLNGNQCISSFIDYSFKKELAEYNRMFLYTGFSASLTFLDSNLYLIKYSFNPETNKECTKKVMNNMLEVFKNSLTEDKLNDRYIISEKKYNSLYVPISGICESIELISENEYALSIIYGGYELVLSLDKKPNNFDVGDVINETNNLISDVIVKVGVLIVQRGALK